MPRPEVCSSAAPRCRRLSGRGIAVDFDYAKADVSLLVYMSIDRLLLFVSSGATVVGLYEAAYRLIQPFYALSTVIRESMFLQLARAIRGDHLAPTMKRWARAMFVPTIPVGPFLSLHGASVIAFVYGAGFANASVALAILGWAITIGFVSGAVVLPFLLWNLGREYGNAVLAGNITNVAANFVLIPPFGASGAAFATVAAKIAVAGVGLGTFRAALEFPIIGWSDEIPRCVSLIGDRKRGCLGDLRRRAIVDLWVRRCLRTLDRISRVVGVTVASTNLTGPVNEGADRQGRGTSDAPPVSCATRHYRKRIPRRFSAIDLRATR